MASETVDETVQETKEQSAKDAPLAADEYDPFAPGPLPVGVRTLQAHDPSRDRLFPCEVWYPAANTQRSQTALRDAAAEPGTYPLIIYSHSSGAGRLGATFLCTHLSSHGYVVAALDHSETVAKELARKVDESDEQKAARVEAWMANRVPDIRFLLDYMLDGAAWDSLARPDLARVGLVGHSFGGWTVLAAPDVEQRVHALVALAPGGSSLRKPGILPAKLAFDWGRDVPTLYLVAEDDVSLPLAGMYELFERTPATKQMVILRRADHMHFMDNVEELHEAVRAMQFPGELSWLPQEMRPIAELCSGAQAHLFVRGLTLCHLDAVLKRREAAQRFLAGDLEAELVARGVDVIAPLP